MQKPIFTGEVTPELVEASAGIGLPQINGKQAVSYARYSVPGKAAVNWFALEDGAEVVRDDAGADVAWPQE